MGSLGVQMNNIVILTADEPSEPWYGPKIQVIAYNQRQSSHAQRLTLLEQPPVRISQEIIVMTSLCQVGQKTENLSLATPPPLLRINM
jgi:hypothetical protein